MDSSFRTLKTARRTRSDARRAGRLLGSLIALLAGIGQDAVAQPWQERLIEAATERTLQSVTYDGSYRRLIYPGGDVPDHVGVCTDLVIRSMRRIGLDLQQLVHEDMVTSFADYPSIWGLSQADANIDHRRVPNLETYLARHAIELPATEVASDYQPGDVVSWRLDGGLPHIGLISSRKVDGSDEPLVIHNIGRGPREEAVLFAYQLHRHFRLTPLIVPTPK